MSEITVTLSRLSGLNLLGRCEERLEEIERQAAAHPHLPMRDPATVQSYESAANALAEALGVKRPE